MNQINNTPNQQNLNFGIKDTSPVVCDKCDSKVFQNGIIFRKVSKFITGTDKDALVPINIPYCVKCNSPLEEMIPKELKEEFTGTNLTI